MIRERCSPHQVLFDQNCLRLDHHVKLQSPRRYLLAAAAVFLVAAVALPLLGHLDLANIAMLFPLAVLFSSIRLGRGPGILAAILSVALFDFFFVPPQFTLVVSDLQYLLTFVVLLAVASITAHLASRLKAERDSARNRVDEAHALNQLAHVLAGALTVESVGEALMYRMPPNIGHTRALFVVSEDAEINLAASNCDSHTLTVLANQAHRLFAQMHHANTIANETSDIGGVALLCLNSGVRVRGIIALTCARHVEKATLETMSTLIAIALERIHYVDVARTSEVEMATERLRNTLLAALSHDIRTPLTALVGLADTLTITERSLSKDGIGTLEAIREEALRTSSLVNNLLEIARFKSGAVKLKREEQPIEEVVGAALAARRRLLEGREIDVVIPHDLPLVSIDAVLMERALCNLIENAAKHSPPTGRISIWARHSGSEIIVAVNDQGPGVTPDAERRHRDSAESGLGLAIVCTIVEAHGGSVTFGRPDSDDATVLIRLPEAS